MLERLQPIPRHLIGGPKRHFVQIARDNGNNALCYEARLTFAVMVGASFERDVRLWLSLVSPSFKAKIERSDRKWLLPIVEELMGPKRAEAFQGPDLVELWDLVSTARHGDGPAALRLQALCPNLWSHNDPELQEMYNEEGLRADTLRVGDGDLDRYFAAAIDFWRCPSPLGSSSKV